MKQQIETPRLRTEDSQFALFLSPIREPGLCAFSSSASKKLTTPTPNGCYVSPEPCFRRLFVEYSPSFRSIQRDLLNNYSAEQPPSHTIPFNEASLDSMECVERAHEPAVTLTPLKTSASPLPESKVFLSPLRIILAQRPKELDQLAPNKLTTEEPLNSDKKNPAGRCCNCKKSQCLKLYCDCFAAGECCKGCSCVDCHNVPSFEGERALAQQLISSKNPVAFQRRISGPGKLACNCSRSGCLKKYCECYKSGAKCGTMCNCTGCKNTPTLRPVTCKKGIRKQQQQKATVRCLRSRRAAVRHVV